MIFNPKKDQLVKIHYRKPLSQTMPCQGVIGKVVFAAKGPGPRNVCVKVDDPGSGLVWRECVPRGNLMMICQGG